MSVYLLWTTEACSFLLFPLLSVTSLFKKPKKSRSNSKPCNDEQRCCYAVVPAACCWECGRLAHQARIRARQWRFSRGRERGDTSIWAGASCHPGTPALDACQLQLTLSHLSRPPPAPPSASGGESGSTQRRKNRSEHRECRPSKLKVRCVKFGLVYDF